MMYGIPFPGTYLIASDGTVRDKVFVPDYYRRPSASEFVLRTPSDAASGTSVRLSTHMLDATISLSTDRCYPGQEIGVALQIRLKPGWHIYGTPLPDRHHATELSFDRGLVDQVSIELPPATPRLLKALGETLPVYEDEVVAIGKLGIKTSPPDELAFLGDWVGERIRAGLHTLSGTLRFQACSDDGCEVPQALRFELPLTIEAPAPPQAPAPHTTSDG
jgi:hypothetical protein